jgi:fused signal recognition particle receptor
MALSAFFSKLKSGLSKTAEKLGQNIAATFTKRKLDDAALEELEDMLVAADLGTAVASRVIGNFRRTRFGKEVTDTEIREALAAEIAAILQPVALPLTPEREKKPW